jgi:hypothetical protein
LGKFKSSYKINRNTLHTLFYFFCDIFCLMCSLPHFHFLFLHMLFTTIFSAFSCCGLRTSTCVVVLLATIWRYIPFHTPPLDLLFYVFVPSPSAKQILAMATLSLATFFSLALYFSPFLSVRDNRAFFFFLSFFYVYRN